MADQPDEIRRDADISQLRSEFAHLDDPMLVEALYRYLEAKRGRRPRLKKARAYLKHVTTNLDAARIWKRLGVSMPPPEVAPAPRTAAPRRRRPGRPGWSPKLFWDRYREAVERTSPPYTQRAVAEHFQALHGDRGIDPEYLRKLLRRYGPPPEIG